MLRRVIFLALFLLLNSIALSEDIEKKSNVLTESLFSAAMIGNLRKVKEAIDKGADVNAKNSAGKTLVLVAATRGHRKIVKFLIEKGADVTSIPLLTPVFTRNTELIKAILDGGGGADINAKMVDGMTVLYTSVERGYPEVVRVLIKNGAKTNIEEGPWGRNWVRESAMDNFDGSVERWEIAKMIIGEEKDEILNSILFYRSIRRYNLKGIKFSLDRGVSINRRGHNDNTPLHLILLNDGLNYKITVPYPPRDIFLKLLKLLTDKGADINARNKEGKTPLMCCLGPNPPLHGRAEWRYRIAGREDNTHSPCADAIKFFIKRPEFVFKIKNDEDKKFANWMLGVITEIGDLKTLKFLVENKGFKISKNILSYVSIRTSKKVIDYLLSKEREIDINPRSSYSHTTNNKSVLRILHYLSITIDPKPSEYYANNIEVIKLLLDNGANINGKDFDGKTSIGYTAYSRCKPGLAAIFIQKGALIDKFDKRKLLRASKSLLSQASKQLSPRPREEVYKVYSDLKARCEEMIKLLESV